MDKEIVYELKSKVSYANKGEMTDAQFVTLLPPTSKNIVECSALKQAFLRALPKPDLDNEVEIEAKDGLVTGEGIMMLIGMSKDVELSKVLLTARDLFTSGNVALVDGEVKMTKPIIDSLSQDDLEGMTGEFMARFILASALQTRKKN